MPLFEADELFVLQPDESIVPGLAPWMDRKISTRLGIRERYRTAFAGPGIYGLFLDNSLFYIGIYSGTQENPFGGSVLDRWSKHVLGMTLRGRKVSFAPSVYRQAAQIAGPVGEALAELVPGGADFAAGNENDHAILRDRGLRSSYNKACFAARHWDIFGPGNEEGMLSRIRFCYVRVPEGPHAPDKAWIKYQWLAKNEAKLIREFRPVCNFQTLENTAAGKGDPDDVEAAIGTLLSEYVDEECSVADRSALSQEMPNEAEDDYSPSLLNSAPHQIRNFVDILVADFPARFEVYFTQNQIRISTNKPSGLPRTLVTMTPLKGGILTGQALADLNTCIRIGLEEAGPVSPAERVMSSRFTIDPAKHSLAQMVQLAETSAEAVGL